MTTRDSAERGAPRRRFPVLALAALVVAVLAVVAAVRWMSADASDTLGDVALMTPAAEDGSQAMALPEGVDAPVVELDSNADQSGEVTVDEDGADVPLPEYEAITLSGRLIVEDGGALPPDLTLSAGLRRASPIFRSLTIGERQPDFARDIGLESGQANMSPDERLRTITRTVPDADGHFEMAGVPATGAWLQVEDAFLYARGPVALLPEPDGADLEIVLSRGARVLGTITDGERPLRGVRVSMQSKMDPWMIFDGAMEMVSVRADDTGADGAYHLDRVPADLTLTASFTKLEYEVLQVSVPEQVPGATYALDGELPTGATVSGAVVDADGAPVPGVRILIQPAAVSMSNLDVMGRIQEESTRTDDDGQFTFGSLSEGSYRVMLAATGYLVAKTDIIELQTSQEYEGVELVAHEGLSVAGQVVDSGGAPIPQAEVLAAVRPSMMSMTANMDRQLREDVDVDEQGRFELAGYEEGGLRIWASAEGFINANVDVDAGDTDIVIEMQRTCAITGIVITLDDAEPLTDYSLSIAPEGGLFDITKMAEMDDRIRALPPRQRVRDEDGTFRIEGAAPGTYTLTVSAKGYAKTQVERVEVVPDKGATGVIILVPEESKVIGQVVSSRTGEPLPGALVTTGRTDIMSSLSAKLTGQTIETETDEDGRFELGGLGTEPVSLTLRHTTHEDLGLGEVVLQEAEVHDLGILTLSMGATLYGHVREPNGTPAPGVNVFASNTTGSMFHRTNTDEFGAWRLEGLSAGSYNVTRMDFSMDMGGDNPTSFMKDLIFKTVAVEQDEEKRVDLVAESGGTTLEGKVRSSFGPEQHAMVWAVREDGPGSLRLSATDDEGMYTIDGLQEGRYLLQVLPANSVAAGAGSQPMAPVSRVVNVGIGPTQREDISMPGGQLVGRTVSKRTGDALEGVRVIAERTDEGRPRSTLLDAVGGRVGEVYSDATGTFTFRHLADGTYDLVAGGTNLLGAGESGWATTRVEGLSVAEGRQGFTMEIELEAGGAIAGIVKDSRGKPLGGMPIWTRDDRTGRWTSLVAETTSGGSGSYEVTSLEPGSWTLAVGGTTHALTLTRSVDVRRERTSDLDVALQKGVEVWLDTSPRRVAEAVVQLTGSWGSVPVDLASVEGLMGGARDPHTRRLGRVMPGTYDLAVVFPGQDTLQQTVTVSGVGGKQTVRLEQLD